MKIKEWIEFVVTQLVMFAFIVGFFIIMAMMINSERWESVNNMIMALLTIVVMIASYKWGSSAGSAKKTEILADQQKNATVDKAVIDKIEAQK
jgi:Ca2+/Na+ antiporter